MIEVIIMAHHKRKDNVNLLFLQLIKDFPTRIIWDKSNDEWDTGKRCLEAATSTCDWTLIIQDDAVLSPYFSQNVKSYLSKAEDTLQSFYFGTGAPNDKRAKEVGKMAKEGKCDVIKLDGLYWGLCIAIPSKDCQELAKLNDGRQYDNRISQFYREKGVCYTYPSLVDHQDGKSLIGHDKIPRKAVTVSEDIIDFKYKVLKTFL